MREIKWTSDQDVPLNQPAAALLAACCGGHAESITPEQAYRAVDYDTLVLLLGMMLISAYLYLGGFFDWAADWILRHAKSPDSLLLHLILTSDRRAFLPAGKRHGMPDADSAGGFRNGARQTPTYSVSIGIGDEREYRERGNPGQEICGERKHAGRGICLKFRFGGSPVYLLPVAAVGLLLVYAILRIGFRKALANAVIVRPRNGFPKIGSAALILTFAVLSLVFVGFLAGLNLSWTALAGGVLVMVLARRDTHEVLKLVDLAFTGFLRLAVHCGGGAE